MSCRFALDPLCGKKVVNELALLQRVDASPIKAPKRFPLPRIVNLLQKFRFLPIKDALQQYGEGCDGRHVQASSGDESKLECFFNVLSLRSFRGRKPSLRTPVGVTIQDRESGAGSVVISATCATTSLS